MSISVATVGYDRRAPNHLRFHDEQQVRERMEGSGEGVLREGRPRNGPRPTADASSDPEGYPATYWGDQPTGPSDEPAEAARELHLQKDSDSSTGSRPGIQQ